jgi:hypothetical protein
MNAPCVLLSIERQKLAMFATKDSKKTEDKDKVVTQRWVSDNLT